MPTNPETGRDFLARAIAGLPEDLRSQAEAIFSSPAATPALDFVGQGVKRQDDYSRNMDEARRMAERAAADTAAAQELARQVRATEAQQVEWWNANRAALEDVERQRANGGTPDPTPAQPVPAGVVTRDYFDATAGEFLGVIGWATTKAPEHLHTFGEVLDVTSLLSDARAKHISLEQAYQDKYHTRYEERAAATKAAYEAKLKADAVEEFRRANPNIPYPLPSSVGVADTLGGLTGDKSQFGPEAAAAEYNRLVAARGAA